MILFTAIRLGCRDQEPGFSSLIVWFQISNLTLCGPEQITVKINVNFSLLICNIGQILKTPIHGVFERIRLGSHLRHSEITPVTIITTA